MKSLILDLDGTLFDSKKTVLNAFKNTLVDFFDDSKNIIDNFVIGPKLTDVISSLNLSKKDEISFKKKFIYYHDEIFLHQTSIYKNVKITLENLSSEHTLILATNKRKYPSISLLKKYNLHHLFHLFYFGDEKKFSSKDHFVNSLMDSFNPIVFVGDTLGDFFVAKKYNIPFIKANYGYGDNQDWSKYPNILEIDEFSDLLSSLDHLN